MTLTAILFAGDVYPCSMYKVTVNGKTFVGNNEDSWGRDARIWFEPATNGKFGVVCVGYARKQPHPDGAMNEHGLVFDAFTMAHKSGLPDRDTNKKDFSYAHIKTIMQQCKTVDEVYEFLSGFNLHVLNGSIIFNGGMLLFVDKTGKYLVVEASKMTFGDDKKFALANFSIADTKDLSTITTERYRKGVAFLNNNKLEASLAFCTALSDTMSVHRAKIGDGTLYTSIYDIEGGLIHLYFFHDFSKRVSFNLKEELSKGDHSYDFGKLFNNNQNFKKFLDYKTPQNSKTISAFILACGILFFSSFAFFMVSFFRSSDKGYNYLKPGLSLLSLVLSVYMYVLLRNESIYYFPSPYNDGRSIIITITSYLPFILLLVVVPLVIVLTKIFRQKKWHWFLKFLFATNCFTYIILTGLFFYWKLFDIFN